MTIGFVSSAAASTSSTGGFQVSRPSGVVDGDFMIAVAACNSASTNSPSPPSGWSNLVTQTGVKPEFCVYVRTANGEPSTYTWTSNGTAVSSVVIAAYRGTGTILTDTVGALSTGSSASPSASGVTATKAGLLVFVAATGLSANGTIWSPPSGMTEDVDSNTGTVSATTLASSAQSAGSSGAKTATTASSSAWGAVLIQLYEVFTPNPIFFGGPF